MTKQVKYEPVDINGQGQAGRESLFNDLYNCFAGIVYGNALAITRCPATAEDVRQEVFYKVWKHIEQMPQVQDAHAYLFVSVRNTCLNFLQKHKTALYGKREYAKYNPEAFIEVEEKLSAKEIMTSWSLLIDRLPPRRKQVYLQVQSGRKYREVAAEMQIARRTVIEQMREANKTIRPYINSAFELYVMKDEKNAA